MQRSWQTMWEAGPWSTSLLPGGPRDSLLSRGSRRKEREGRRRQGSSQGQEERLKPVPRGWALQRLWKPGDPIETRAFLMQRGGGGSFPAVSLQGTWVTRPLTCVPCFLWVTGCLLSTAGRGVQRRLLGRCPPQIPPCSCGDEQCYITRDTSSHPGAPLQKS